MDKKEDKHSFINLVNELYTENRELSNEKIIQLFKYKEELVNILEKECDSNNEPTSPFDIEFIRILINLPQITFNIFKELNEKFFKPENYYPSLCSIIYKALTISHKKLRECKDQNLSLITILIGKICLNKQEDIYWSKIGQKLYKNSKNDLIWRKITNRLIQNQNENFLEKLIKPLLLNVNNYEHLKWYLNDCSNNKVIKHLLTNKFLLVYTFNENVQIIENIIGFLANYYLDLFKQALFDVLSTWSNAILVRHQTVEQHFYLCKILICSLKFLKKLKIDLKSNNYLSLILHGAETHLKMVELDKRNNGLFVVEQLTNYLDINQNLSKEDKLNFELELNENLLILKNLLEDNHKIEKQIDNKQENQNKNNDIVLTENEESEQEEEEDDDEDLKPFDMSGDTKLTKFKKPIYLKDCLEGLMNVEDIDYNTTCLESLPELIQKNKSQASELCQDFLRILLFLENEDEELKKIRFDSMVKFCNLNPTNSAKYLCVEIYEQNVSIARKMDILDVIVETSKQLSRTDYGSIEDNSIKSIQNIVKNSKKEWERIIEERVKLKTKILTTATKLPLVGKNQFLEYVNQYFFELLKSFDHKEVAIKFKEDDYFLLGKLILTFAELLKSVSQTHLTRKMSIALIEFLNVFKYHQESYVKKAIVMCIHSIVTNVSPYFIFEDLLKDLFDFREYLLNLRKIDPETFHSHGVLTLIAIEEQLIECKNRLKFKKPNQSLIKFSERSLKL